METDNKTDAEIETTFDGLLALDKSDERIKPRPDGQIDVIVTLPTKRDAIEYIERIQMSARFNVMFADSYRNGMLGAIAVMREKVAEMSRLYVKVLKLCDTMTTSINNQPTAMEQAQADAAKRKTAAVRLKSVPSKGHDADGKIQVGNELAADQVAISAMQAEGGPH